MHRYRITTFLVALAFSAPFCLARSFGKPYLACELSDKQINESSGLCPSWNEAGMYFTHNDSGDTARFFRFDLTGKVLSNHTLMGIAAVDWEDMASAQVKGMSFIYLGDIGDNARKRKSIQIYRCTEPPADQQQIKEFETYDLTYPDGAQDAEALMVHPQTGDIYVATKNLSGVAKVYKLAAPVKSGSYKLQLLGSVSLGFLHLVTGGAISPDGGFVVLRTYQSAYEFHAPDSFDDWLNAPRLPARLAEERQGEAITYSLDGLSLLTSSEGTPCPISIVPIKK